MTFKTLALFAVTALLSVSCATGSNSNQPAAQNQPSPLATETTAAQPSPSPAQSTAQAATRSGAFVAGEHPTQGTARILTENGKNYLELDENFRTDSGPDLFVILHRASDIKSVSQPTAYGLNEGDYAIVAPLKQVNGTQRYAIPDNIKLTDYNSAAVWCRQFNATFGYAPLQ